MKRQNLLTFQMLLSAAFKEDGNNKSDKKTVDKTQGLQLISTLCNLLSYTATVILPGPPQLYFA